MLKKIMQKIKSSMPLVTVQNRRVAEYDLLKNKLVYEHTGIVKWELEVEESIPVSPSSVVIWSQEFREVLGYSDEQDFPNQLYSWSRLLHPEDKESVLSVLNAHIYDKTGATPYDVEYRLMVKGGEYRCFRAHGTTLRDSKGIPQRIDGILVDINDARQLERTIKDHASGLERKQKVLESIKNVGVALLSANLSVFNKAIIKNMGLMGEIINADRVQIWRNESIGRNLHFSLTDEWLSEYGTQIEPAPKCRTFPYDAVPGWEEKLKRGKQVNSPIFDLLPHEYTFFNRQKVKSLMVIPLFKSGSFWGFLRIDDCKAERVFSDDEMMDVNTAGQFIAFALMLSESLDAIHTDAKKATELKHWYQSVLDAVPIPISVTDANMSLVFINTAIERMIGKKRENIYGRHCSVLNTEICNTTDCGIACAKKFVNKTYYKSSGKSYQVDVSKISDLNGETAGFVEVIQDVTDSGVHNDDDHESIDESANATLSQ